MHFKLFGAATVAAFFLFAPLAAEASCCDQKEHAGHQAKGACCQQACCKDTKSVEPSAIDTLLAMDPQFNPAPPVRQSAEVWFQRPVLVGRSIVQGRYVIEHDNDRMARGEPCTHLYPYKDRSKPVATFRCTHLERDRASRNVVVLATTSDGNMQTLTEFQFAGDTSLHGYPSGH